MLVNKESWKHELYDDSLFMGNTLNSITGFLDEYAAKRTIDLFNFQHASDITGSLYEIGIYYGKYFSLLVRSAARTGSRVVGIDSFDYINIEEFHRYFDDKFDPVQLAELSKFEMEIIRSRSGDLSVDNIRRLLQSEPRFISIDGSHEYNDVLWDLRVADQVVAASGLIAVDDFLHPISLGVTAAVYEFIFSNPNLVPFAYISNKLFLCRSSWADRYRDALEKAIIEDRSDPKSREYCVHLGAMDRHNIESSFRGYKILTVRL